MFEDSCGIISQVRMSGLNRMSETKGGEGAKKNMNCRGGNIVKKELNDLAKCMADRLIAEGFIVQRYDAYSTSSIYLKLDYGVCNSIRISDHNGKKHLKYRYNIGPHIKEFRAVMRDRYPRLYYPIGEAEKMIDKILRDRDSKIDMYGCESYAEFMLKK